MIVAPDILGQVQWPPSAADAVFRGQAALEIAPEAFQAVDAVDMGAGSTAIVPLSRGNEPMHRAFSGNAGVAAQRIRTHDHSPLHPTPDQGLQRQSADIRHHVGPHMAAAAMNAQDGRLQRGAAPPWTATRAMAAVPPLAAQLGLVDFDDATEDGWHIEGQALAHLRQGPQPAASFEVSELRDLRAADSQQKITHQCPPLPPGQPQRQLAGTPLVSTGSTTAFVPSNRPTFSAWHRGHRSPVFMPPGA